MPAHATVDQLLRIADSVASVRAAAALPHVLGCATCRQRQRRVLSEIVPAAPAAPPLPAAAEREGFFRRLDSPYLAAFAAGAREAPARAAALCGQPWREARALFLALSPAGAVPVILHLVDQAHETAETSPLEGARLGRLAVRLCRELDPGAVSEETRAEVEARAWLVTGYATALAGEASFSFMPGFKRAEDRLTDLDGPEAAVLSRLFGSVLHRRGRPAQALALLERAERLFRETGEVLEEARALSEQAVVYAETGSMGRALALLGRALALQGPWMPLEEALRSRLTLAVLHAAVGHPRVAGELLLEVESEARAVGVELRALFALTRARLAAERRDRTAAERLLGEALAGALATGAHGEGAAAAFHLAAIHAGDEPGAALIALAEDARRLAAPGHLTPELRTLLRRLAALLRSGEATRERVLALQRRFKNRLPRSPWPLQGLAVLCDELLTKWLVQPQPGFRQPAAQRAGGASPGKENGAARARRPSRGAPR